MILNLDRNRTSAREIDRKKDQYKTWDRNIISVVSLCD